MMEKIYRVQMNSNGMPNFSTAVEVADRPQGWIPCSERLPSKGVAVLVSGIAYDALPITISINAPYEYEQGWINAWMPLPKPWKGADDYERAIEQMEHDALYEPTYNSEDGSM